MSRKEEEWREGEYIAQVTHISSTGTSPKGSADRGYVLPCNFLHWELILHKIFHLLISNKLLPNS